MTDQPNKTSWNYQPASPIPVSPLLSWPPRPLALLRWISGYWIAISSTVVEFMLAWAIFALFHPDTAVMQTLHWGWAAQIWLRNVALVCLVAGGLHLWLYSWARQGKKLKFEHRGQADKNRAFTFSNQVRDNMFWTLASGVTVWTAFEVLYFWAAANGYAPGLRFAEAPIWFALWFVLIPIWTSFHFYWVHRLLHWPPLYTRVHALHHRNVNVGPWSGLSMHPVEHLIYFTNIAIHFVVPSHPAHVLFHFYVQGLNPLLSHSGFDGIVAGDRKRFQAGDFFHQLHHRYFECNYGTAEVPWDVVFGSFHDGSEEATQATRARKKRMYAK